MAGHIQDRWYRTENGPDGKPHRVKSDRYGTGMRYRARYAGPDGTEKNKSFPDRQKRLAEQWLTQIAADMSRGSYIDPRAGRVTFRQYAEKWLASHTTDINGHDAAERRLRLHAFPYIGTRPVASFQPGHIRTWLSELASAVPAASYRRIIFGLVSAIFSAAVDDTLIPRNPCLARSVRGPQPDPNRVVPWTPEQVFAVRTALPERFRAMVDVGGGCGLRQGEIFGLPVDEVDFNSGWLAVRVQVKRVRGKFVFAPPKRGKTRDVPLSGAVGAALRKHMEGFPQSRSRFPGSSQTGRRSRGNSSSRGAPETACGRATSTTTCGSAHSSPQRSSRRPSRASGTRPPVSTGCTPSDTSTPRCCWMRARASGL